MSCHHEEIPRRATVAQEHNVLNDVEILAGCTPATVEESSGWTSVVNSAENRVQFCKGLDGKPHFCTLYGMCMVLKVSAQAGQNGAMNKPSVQSTIQNAKSGL
jgi:hypothetical protein